MLFLVVRVNLSEARVSLEVLRKVKMSFPYVRLVVHVPHVREINDNLERTTIHNVVIFEK